MSHDKRNQLVQNEMRMEDELRSNQEFMGWLENARHPFFLHLSSEPVRYSQIGAEKRPHGDEVLIQKDGAQLWLRQYNGDRTFDVDRGSNQVSVAPGGFFYEIHVDTSKMADIDPIRRMIMVRNGLRDLLDAIQNNNSKIFMDVPIVGTISHLSRLAEGLDPNIVWTNEDVLPQALIENYAARMQGAVDQSNGTRTVEADELKSILCTPAHLKELLDSRRRK